jgi:hypothetical protein
MTTTEKLNAIADKCRDLLAQNAGLQTQAGWRTTLAAIESVSLLNRGSSPSRTLREERLITAIIAAWDGLQPLADSLIEDNFGEVAVQCIAESLALCSTLERELAEVIAERDAARAALDMALVQ